MWHEADAMRQTSLEGRTNMDERQLARGLGWMSLGLGAAQILAPGWLARGIGARDNRRTRTLQRAIGAREIASGLGILTQSWPAGWLWARVTGDLMDIGLVSAALRQRGARPDRLAG